MPGSLDRVAERAHPVHVDVRPAVEGQFADPSPEFATGEPVSATATFVVSDVALPEMDDFTESADAGQFTE
ncbi:hypothetical protein Q0Z83_080680 [Actinoplanes sichuanensis]|nr:hypothetical protein Q0Z83_080680 [Actinoplanes sichuanensis]